MSSMFMAKMKMAVIAAGVVIMGCVIAVAQVAGGDSTPLTTSKMGEAPAPFMNGQPAPINEYKGMQDREEVFEFAVKPQVQGSAVHGSTVKKYSITFTSKAACDATVSIVDTNGVVIRHLASGVLGKNAPYPFQQDSLSQKLEWDGLTDDYKKAPAGCKVLVSLGLKAKYERNIGISGSSASPGGLRVLYGKAEDGTMYIGTTTSLRSYDKDGKYLRTLIPASAGEIEKFARVTTTIWGDKVPVGSAYAVFGMSGFQLGHPDGQNTSLDQWREIDKKEGRESQLKGLLRMADLIQSQPGVKEKVTFAAVPGQVAYCRVRGGQVAPSTIQLPADHPISKLPGGTIPVGVTRQAVDRQRDLLYIGAGTLYRYDAMTGETDKSWKTLEMGDGLSEIYPDLSGRVYIRAGGSGYGYIMFSVDRGGKVIPFKKNVAADGDIKKYCINGGRDATVMGCAPRELRGMSITDFGAVYCGADGYCNCFALGLHVSPNGQIVTGLREGSVKWAIEKGVVKEGTKGSALKFCPIQVWTPEGDLLTADAVEGMALGHNAVMDRDGNIYLVQGCMMPAGQKHLDGLTEIDVGPDTQGGGGTLIKFRGQGGKYPLGKFTVGDDSQGAKFYRPQDGNRKVGATGVLWSYGGVTGQGGGTTCNCNFQRLDMDPWARSWIGSTALFSVMVLDANGNRIARLGRYGNEDDTVADLKAGRDGIRFGWSRSVAVSDKALYIADSGNERHIKATIYYATEETVDLSK